MPRVMELLRAVAGGQEPVSDEAQAFVYMVVAITIQMTPRHGEHADLFVRAQRLGSDLSPLQRQERLYDEAYATMERLSNTQLGLEGVQALILLHQYDKHPEADFLYRARNALLSLEAHRIHQPFSMSEWDGYHKEMLLRCWWLLVVRDWFGATTKLFYSIHPAQMTTRMPSIEADCNTKGHVIAPHSRWSQARYSLELIRLASTVRELVDARLTQGDGWRFGQQVEERFCQLVASLSTNMRVENPFHIRDWPNTLGSTTSQEFAQYRDQLRIEKDRWFLHQALFHAYLELQSHADDGALINQTSVTLARHILDINDRIRDRCPVIDSLRVNSSAALKACSVLLLAELNTSTGYLSRCVLVSRVECILRKCSTAKTQKEDSIVRALLARMRTSPPLTPPTSLSSSAPESNLHDASQQEQSVQSKDILDELPSLSTLSQQAMLASASPSVDLNEIYEWHQTMPSDAAISPGFLMESIFESKMHAFEDMFGSSAIDPNLQASPSSHLHPQQQKQQQQQSVAAS